MARITISDSIKQEIAEKVCEQAAPGYEKLAQGQWFVVNGEKVVHAQEHRSWDPWHEDDEVVAVDDLLWYCGGARREHADFDPSPAEGEYDEATAWEIAVEFALGYVPDAYDTKDLPYREEA